MVATASLGFEDIQTGPECKYIKCDSPLRAGACTGNLTLSVFLASHTVRITAVDSSFVSDDDADFNKSRLHR